MNDPLPRVGWPLHMAIFELVTEPWRKRAWDTHVFESHPSRQEDTAGRRLLWLDICRQLMTGELVAKGFLSRPTTLADAVNVQTIEPQFFAGAVAIFDRNIVTMSNGVVFVDVRIFRPAAAGAPDTSDPSRPPRSQGGAPEKYDWDGFTREVVRFARFDEFNSRRQLTTHMKDWCSRTWDSQPNERAIEKKVAAFCPDAIPAR